MTPRCARVVDDSGQSAPFARVCVVKTLVLRVLFVCVCVCADIVAVTVGLWVVACAQEELRTLKYSILKDKLLSVESSRAAQLQWLTEFLVFVGSHHSALSEFPNLTFQYAVNQVQC